MAARDPAPPTEATLREAALRHLSRYGTTRAGLLRVLARRVARWARTVAAPEEAVSAAMRAAETTVAGLAAAGAVNDAAFAESRARSLHRAGRSRRAIAAHLHAKGVSVELAAALPDDPAHELTAALLYASRRRLGPFRQPPDPAQRPRDLARLARAGFQAGIAAQALRMPLAEAEQRVFASRR